ncbi:MAG: hemerythrin family protein [Myxococcales bacterium]|nr:hemerythrin family protein [Myxococcales bacterium]
MKIAWTPDLAIGDGMIDRQHKELFAQVDRLVTAIREKRNIEEVREIVDFLERYVIVHFDAEERLMEQAYFPDINSHRREHARFVEKWKGLKAIFEREGPSLAFALSLNRVVVSWLRYHIAVRDKAVGRYIAERAKAA